MSKNEQTVKAISDMLARLRAEMAAYVKATEDKIAGLEIAYEALTGDKPSHPEKPKATPRAPRQSGRRGMKIDRQASKKTYAFLKERGEKPTTVKMVARKFNITPEAASQRLLTLLRSGGAARVADGEYVASEVVQNGVNATA
jgi:hypothetical protein